MDEGNCRGGSLGAHSLFCRGLFRRAYVHCEGADGGELEKHPHRLWHMDWASCCLRSDFYEDLGRSDRMAADNGNVFDDPSDSGHRPRAESRRHSMIVGPARRALSPEPKKKRPGDEPGFLILLEG